MTQINRWLQLWSPFQRRAINVGIIKADGSIAFKPCEKAQEIRNHWGTVFDEKTIDIEKARRFANKFCTKLNFQKAKIRTPENIDTFLSKTKHSAPGPDGIPYKCWHATGPKGHRTLHRALLWTYDGKEPADDFNHQMGIFAPKGSLDQDSADSVNRTADCTRPLGLKNTDNKTLAGVTNNAIATPVSEGAHVSQNGFVNGRQGLNNVVTLDAQSRKFDLVHAAQKNKLIADTPFLAFFDFCAAFPSIAHTFIFIVLEAVGLPQGLINFFKTLYTNNRCYSTFNGQTVFLYILSGIIQGCPASGTIFVIAVDPFLRLPDSIIKKNSHLRLRR